METRIMVFAALRGGGGVGCRCRTVRTGDWAVHTQHLQPTTWGELRNQAARDPNRPSGWWTVRSTVAAHTLRSTDSQYSRARDGFPQRASVACSTLI